MRAVVQRVAKASVTIDGIVRSQIGKGLLVLLGIEEGDNAEDIDWLVRKILNMRIFPDENEVMNESLLGAKGDVLVVSQFTLYASTRKGNRPSYIRAAKSEIAILLYQKFILCMENELGKNIATGEFGADMKVALINDGPVTILIDSKSKE